MIAVAGRSAGAMAQPLGWESRQIRQTPDCLIIRYFTSCVQKLSLRLAERLGTLAGGQLSRFNRFDCWRQQLGPSIIIAQRWFPERLPAGVARTRLAYSVNWVSRRSGIENPPNPLLASHNWQRVNLRFDFD